MPTGVRLDAGYQMLVAMFTEHIRSARDALIQTVQHGLVSVTGVLSVAGVCVVCVLYGWVGE